MRGPYGSDLAVNTDFVFGRPLGLRINVSGQAFEARFPLNDYYGDGNRPTDVWVRIRRDPSLPGPWRREGMAYVGIVNWPGSSSAAGWRWACG